MTYQHALRYLTATEADTHVAHLPVEELRALSEPEQARPLLICFSHDKQAAIAARLMRSALDCAGIGCLHVIEDSTLEVKERFILDSKPLSPTLLCSHAQAVRTREILLRRASEQESITFPLPERTAAVLLRCAAEWNTRVVLLESNEPTLFRAFAELGVSVSITAVTLTDEGGHTAISTIGPTTTEVISHAGGAAVIRALSDVCARHELRLTVIPRSGIYQRSATLGSQLFDSAALSDCRLPSGTALVRDAAVLVIQLALLLRRRGFAISDEHLRGGLSRAVLPYCLTPISIHPLVIADRVNSKLELNATLHELEALETSLPRPLYICCEPSLRQPLSAWAVSHGALLDDDGTLLTESEGTRLFLGSATFLEKMCAKIGSVTKKV